VGLHYLKHAYNVSDEAVVEQFVENGYWQYFCGFEYFQHGFPLDPTTLVKWRKRIGPKGIEKLLQVTIDTAKTRGYVTEKHLGGLTSTRRSRKRPLPIPRIRGFTTRPGAFW